jgi:hypothetical protein
MELQSPQEVTDKLYHMELQSPQDVTDTIYHMELQSPQEVTDKLYHSRLYLLLAQSGRKSVSIDYGSSHGLAS